MIVFHMLGNKCQKCPLDKLELDLRPHDLLNDGGDLFYNHYKNNCKIKPSRMVNRSKTTKLSITRIPVLVVIGSRGLPVFQSNITSDWRHFKKIHKFADIMIRFF